MNYPQVRYYLSSESIGRVLLEFEPENWNEDGKTLVRNTDNWGVMTQLSNDLIFVKDGRQLLQQIYDREGTEVNVVLERFVIETINQSYELDYKGDLDMKTYVLNDEKVSVQFLTGGLQSLVESQFDEAYELQRTTDINGNNITVLEYDDIYWEGRRIFLESLAETAKPPEGFILSSSVQNDAQIYSRNINTFQVYESDGLEITNAFNLDLFNLTPYAAIYEANGIDKPNSGSFFKINISEVDDSFNYKISFSTKHGNGFYSAGNAASNYALKVALAYYDRIDEQWEFNRLDDIHVNSNFIGNVSFSFSSEGQGLLLANQAVSLCPYISRTTTATANSVGEMNFFNIQSSIKLEQNSTFQPTEFKGIRLYDAFERMLEIYTGQRNRIKSQYFDLGEFKDVLLSSGTQIRNLPTVRENQSLPVSKLTVELKDLYETNNYFNLGWSIETHNGKEFYVVEDKDYFFVDYPLIDLGEVSQLKITCASEFLFKSGTFGNSKAGDYEEVQGLQEYNALTTYQTHLKTSENKYEVEAEIRADLLGAELARRKNFTVAPTEDTRYDDQNFLFDSKAYEINKFTPKVWQDSLSQQPICYDPESAGNLLLTPFRSMERHSLTFGAGLTKYPDKFVRYSSGSGKVEVATKIGTEPIRYENSNIKNSELKTAIYQAEFYEFESPLNTAIRRKLRESTFYNDRTIPNTNFLIKFTSKKQDYYGYIVEVGFNDPGTWKLIKKNQ
jgi:hypothetical protein